MDIWSILGIAPTDDLTAITAAYRAKLPSANPEDAPESFKELRSAYEQARRQAAQRPRGDADASPAGRWLAALSRLYADLPQRTDPSAWRALLADPFCKDASSHLQARGILLRFLQSHYFLPQEIWRMLDSEFALQESAADLSSAYPRDFVENTVLSGIRNRELLPYALFSGDGAACDEYLRNFSRFRSAVGDGRLGDAGTLLAQLEQSGAQHPYTQLCRARLALAGGDAETARKELQPLLEQLPDDLQVLLLDAQLAMQAEDFARAETELRTVLAHDPELAQAKYDLAGSLSGQGKYIEAKALYLELNKALPYNALVIQQFEAANRKVLPLREEKYAVEPEDLDNALELGWCYHQMRQELMAQQIVDALSGSCAGRPDYENLAAKVALGRGDMATALACLRRWEAAILRAPETDAGTKERLPEALRLQAAALARLKRQPEAQTLLQTVLARWPEDSAAWQLKAQFALRDGALDEALEDGQRLRELAPADSYGSYFCGIVLFRMGRMQEAYQCFEAVVRQSGRDAGCLLYQCRILIDTGRWEEAKKLLRDLSAAKADSPALEYCLARMAAHEKDTAEAERHYLALLPACRDPENPPDFAGEVFYRLACLQYPRGDKKQLLALAEEGLARDADSVSLWELKADLLRELERIPEAISVYEELCRRVPAHPSAAESLGRLYQFRIFDCGKAAQAYRRQLAVRESPELRNLLGICCEELADWKGAEDAFLLAIRQAPEEPAYRANLAEFYLLAARFGQAEPAFRDALRLPVRRRGDRLRLRRGLSMVYSRTGRPAEAAALLEQNARQEYAYADLAQAAEVWAAAGNAAAALDCLKRWRRLASPAEGEWCGRRATLCLVLRDMRGMRSWLRRGFSQDAGCARRYCALLCGEGRFPQARRLQERLLRRMPEDELLLSALAFTCRWMRDEAAAARYAGQGLAALERARGRLNPAMYQTRRAGLLLSQGELAQAEAALQAAQQAPLCAHCIHSRCKDALSVQALLLEQRGQPAKALALLYRAAAEFPDEEDFMNAISRIHKG